MNFTARYPGIRPFTEREQHIFFGRDLDVDRICRSLRLNKVLTIYGKRGVGKTSLLQAGIIPKLRQSDTDNYDILTIRFFGYTEDHKLSPLDSLKETILLNTTVAHSISTLIEDDESLWYLVKKWQFHHENKKLLLIFDQFEELFTHPESQIRVLERALSELIIRKIPSNISKELRDKEGSLSDQELDFFENHADVRMVFVVRTREMSYLFRLSKYIRDILNNRFELAPLTREQAEDAIILPALINKNDTFRSPVFSYSDAGLDRLLNDLSPDGLFETESAHLQIICQYLEDKVLQEQLPVIDSRDIGDVNHILKGYYQESLNILDEDERSLVSIFIEEGLISESEKIRLSVPELSIQAVFGISAELLHKLESIRLLRRDPGTTGEYRYELASDLLIEPALEAKRQRYKLERLEMLKREREEQQRKFQEEKEIIRLKSRRQTILLTTVVLLSLLINIILLVKHLK
jgi:hypothetical protein